jgi:hypothetical protein
MTCQIFSVSSAGVKVFMWGHQGPHIAPMTKKQENKGEGQSAVPLFMRNAQQFLNLGRQFVKRR